MKRSGKSRGSRRSRISRKPSVQRKRNIPKGLHDLVGKKISGIVRKTAPDYVALLIDFIEDFDQSSYHLVKMAKVEVRRLGWNVSTPRSWKEIGPHVSLDDRHIRDVGKRFQLTVTGVMVWEKNHRWVALKLKGPLKDKTGWILHMSCAQQVLS